MRAQQFFTPANLPPPNVHPANYYQEQANRYTSNAIPPTSAYGREMNAPNKPPPRPVMGHPPQRLPTPYYQNQMEQNEEVIPDQEFFQSIDNM
jgi:hypothetical protein